MRKFPFVILLAIAASIPALGQTGARYPFDNFDTHRGIVVESVKTAPPSSASQMVRPVAKVVASGINASLSPASAAYTQPRRSVMMTASKPLDEFTTGDSLIDSYIIQSAERNGVNPVLLYSIMHQESSFKPRAMSNKGARGLMQLMPATAARFGVTNIFDPRQNIEGGARYISLLLNMFEGDVALALAGYNAGEGAVLKYGRRVPPYRETQEYVRRIGERYALMRDPQTARNARPATKNEVAATNAEKALPLTDYEQNVFAVRLPDGRLQLVSQ